MKKSIFKASFEESLNLEDDGFVQYQNNDVFSRLEKYYKEGKVTIRLHIWNLIGVMIGPIFFNFMIFVFSLSLHDSDSKDLRFPISGSPILAANVYLICFLLWLFIILVGKGLKRTYILPYRNHFHVLTYIIWLGLEFNLLMIDICLSILSVWIIIGIVVCTFILSLFMVSFEINSIKETMYGERNEPTLHNKISKKILTYGGGVLELAVITNFIIKSFSINVSDSMGVLGVLLMWIIMNIALLFLLIFIEFPTYLLAFYKWKYPEEYREWEGKSLEEWYGKKYLKKHKESLEAKNDEKINL